MVHGENDMLGSFTIYRPAAHLISVTNYRNQHFSNYFLDSRAIVVRLTRGERDFSLVVFFLSGDSLASEFYVPKFRNTLSVPSS
jgi:hypothetical protein